MSTVMTLAGGALLVLAGLGWLMALAPRMAGRVRLLTLLTIALFGLSTALLGFGVGGIGAPFPGWQQILQATEGVFYGAAFITLAALYLSPVSVAWSGWNGLVVYGGALLVAGAAATAPGVTDVLPYLLLALIGAGAVRYTDRDWLIRTSRRVLMVLCVGSLLYLTVDFAGATSNPDIAYGLDSGPYKSSIGVPFRLHGLTSHGVTLSMVAAVALLLGAYRPARFKAEWLWQASAFACLVLSQGKSGWVAFGVALAVLGLYRASTLPRIKRRAAQSLLLLVIGAGIAASTIYAPQVDPETWTFTGRTTVWDITLAEFRANPLTGYGPGLWDAAYREHYSLPWVGQAHNQYVQTLGQAGLIGALGLGVLLWSLIAQAWRSRHATSGLSLALVAALLIRGASEANLRYGLDVGALLVLLTYWVATKRHDTPA